MTELGRHSQSPRVAIALALGQILFGVVGMLTWSRVTWLGFAAGVGLVAVGLSQLFKALRSRRSELS